MTLAFLMHRVLNRFGVAAAVVAHSMLEKFSSPAIRDANERAEMLARAEGDIEVWDGLPDELWPGRVAVCRRCGDPLGTEVHVSPIPDVQGAHCSPRCMIAAEIDFLDHCDWSHAHWDLLFSRGSASPGRPAGGNAPLSPRPGTPHGGVS